MVLYLACERGSVELLGWRPKGQGTATPLHLMPGGLTLALPTVTSDLPPPGAGHGTPPTSQEGNGGSIHGSRVTHVPRVPEREMVERGWPPEGGLGPLRGWHPLWHHPNGCWLWPVTGETPEASWGHAGDRLNGLRAQVPLLGRAWGPQHLLFTPGGPSPRPG